TAKALYRKAGGGVSDPASRRSGCWKGISCNRHRHRTMSPFRPNPIGRTELLVKYTPRPCGTHGRLTRPPGPWSRSTSSSAPKVRGRAAHGAAVGAFAPEVPGRAAQGKLALRAPPWGEGQQRSRAR